MSDFGSIGDELRRRDIFLKKSLGQNFLVDENLARKIVEAAEIKPGERVLEIGPGAGALTRILLETGARVLAVEIDQRFVDLLADRFAGEERFRPVHGDFLKYPASALREFADGGLLKVVANLPYYNSSQVLFRLASVQDMLDRAVLTLQKELAQRLAAKPGGKEYGALSVKLQSVAQIRPVVSLPASVFVPAPSVDSLAVLLDFRKPALPDDISYDELARCAAAAFSSRRKMLSNALASAYRKAEIPEILRSCGVDPSLRGETLGIETFFLLTRALRGAVK